MQENQDQPDARNAQRSNILLWRLAVMAQERGESAQDVARQIKVSYPYFMALLRGQRPIENASKEVLTAIANYLGISVAQAYVWAGVLRAEDFFSPKSLQTEMADLYRHMMSNPEFGTYVPTPDEWRSLPTTTKVLIAALYERATGERFLSALMVPGLGDAPRNDSGRAQRGERAILP